MRSVNLCVKLDGIDLGIAKTMTILGEIWWPGNGKMIPLYEFNINDAFNIYKYHHLEDRVQFGYH